MNLFQVNGNPILIRGAGWTPDLFLRTDRARQRAEMSYIRHMNLNAVRLEGPSLSLFLLIERR